MRRFFKKKILNLINIAMVTSLFASDIVIASGETGDLTLSAAVENSCSVAAEPVSFGSYAGVELNGRGVIHVNCTKGANYVITLGQGSSFEGGERHLLKDGGSDTLAYKLYQDNAGTEWKRVSGISTGEKQSYSVYAKIASGQSVSSGDYADTVVVNVTF